jgi:hypothetical protein
MYLLKSQQHVLIGCQRRIAQTRKLGISTQKYARI